MVKKKSGIYYLVFLSLARFLFTIGLSRSESDVGVYSPGHQIPSSNYSLDKIVAAGDSSFYIISICW